MPEVRVSLLVHLFYHFHQATLYRLVPGKDIIKSDRLIYHMITWNLPFVDAPCVPFLEDHASSHQVKFPELIF